jgi:protein ImuA
VGSAGPGVKVRAATNLIPLLRVAGTAAMPNLWHADDLAHAALAAECASSGFAPLDAELPGGGWPAGQLIELLHDDPGIGELRLLAPALAAQAHAGRACVWVLPCECGPRADDPLKQALPYPPALTEAGIDPSCSIFVRPAVAREAWWAIEQSLRAAHLGVLIGWLPTSNASADFRALRRLHLLAQRHRALLFVIRPARCADAPSPAVLRLQLDCDGQQLTVRILKRRGRPLIEPVALQVYPAQWNRSIAPAPATHTAAGSVAVTRTAQRGPLRILVDWAW